MQGCHLCLISVVPPMTLLNVAGPCLAPGVTFWWCLVAIMLLFFGLFMFLPLLPKGKGAYSYYPSAIHDSEYGSKLRLDAVVLTSSRCSKSTCINCPPSN